MLINEDMMDAITTNAHIHIYITAEQCEQFFQSLHIEPSTGGKIILYIKVTIGIITNTMPTIILILFCLILISIQNAPMKKVQMLFLDNQLTNSNHLVIISIYTYIISLSYFPFFNFFSFWGILNLLLNKLDTNQQSPPLKTILLI